MRFARGGETDHLNLMGARGVTTASPQATWAEADIAAADLTLLALGCLKANLQIRKKNAKVITFDESFRVCP